MSDRRRARTLYARARFLTFMAVGFTIGSLVYPSRPYMLPSTGLAFAAAGSALIVVAAANYLWGRDR